VGSIIQAAFSAPCTPVHAASPRLKE